MSEKMQYVKSGIFSYSGKIVTIFSSFVYTFLIANYLGPEQYGLVNYYISFTLGLIGVFGVYFLGGLVNVFMPKWKSKTFLRYVLCAVSFLSVMLFVFMVLFSKDISVFLGRSNDQLLQLTAFLLLIMPSIVIYTALFRSFKMFGKELKFHSIVAVLNLVLAFALVIVFDFGVWGVVYAMVLSNLAGLVLIIYQSRFLKYVDKPINFSEIKKYSLFGVPATFFHRIDGQMLLVFMGFFLADSALGLYYVAFKIASLLLSLPVNTLCEILLPYVSGYAADKHKLARYVSLSIKFSLIITLILSLLVILFSKFILIILFPEYVACYSFIVLFTVMFLISSVNPLISLFLSLNRMDIIMRSYFGGFMSTLVFGLLLIPWLGVYGLIFTQILNTFFSRGILVYYLKAVDFEVDIIPKMRDFRYFWSSLKDVFSVGLNRLKN